MSQGKQPEKNILNKASNIWYMMLSFIVLWVLEYKDNKIIIKSRCNLRKILLSAPFRAVR